MNEQQTLASGASPSVSRRRFIGYAGALAGVGLLAGNIACTKADDPLEGAIDVGSSDTGVLNVAFILAQLKYAFYAQVINIPYTPLKQTDVEYKILLDIRDHELAHREFFRKLLSSTAVMDITPDFSSVYFIKRTSVLDTAKMFADLSASAYNGGAKLLSTDPLLEVFTKIASVQARHAAAIRDMIQMGSFADSTIVGSDGLEPAREPADVIAIVAPFIKERINPKNLPTS